MRDPKELTNVMGNPLLSCCMDPVTGFYRNGYCQSGPGDHGKHTVCAKMTEAFLAYSRRVGNDLITPMPEYAFPGLLPGDHWCLCVERWVEAYQAGCAPPIVLEACHLSALEYVDLEVLQQFAISQT